MKCCVNCFSEHEIQNYIESIDELGNCDYCNDINVNVANVADVGEFIRDGVKRAYESIDDGTGAFYDSELKEYSEEGQTLEEILNWELGIFSENFSYEKSQELCDDLINESGPSERDIKHGECDWLANDYLVFKDALYGEEITKEHISWENFKYTCKYINRYFDLGGRKSARAIILSDLDELFSKMKTTLPKGFTLYRARVYELEDCKTLDEINLLKELSPAPPNKSKNNRMSPAGISYTYLSDKVDTCLSEIKAQIGNKVLVGKFVTKSKLKLLDLSKEPNLITKSIFSEDYNHNENWIGDFVKHFKQEISLIVDDNNKEIEYVATQVLAEYIRKMGFHGIKYESSLTKGSYNYVLFCSINPDIIPHEYRGIGYFDNELCPFTDWLNLKSVDYDKLIVSYKTVQSINHDDDKAEYKKIEKERKKLYDKLSKGYDDDLVF